MANGYLKGLLGDEYEDAQKGAFTNALLMAGLQGLMASGPSLTPTSTGQIIGQAGMAGLEGYQGAMQRAEQQGLKGMELEEVERERQANEAFNAALPQIFQNGKINYPELQRLALVYPERVGQVIQAYQAAQPPRPAAPKTSFREIYNEQGQKVTVLVNDSTGEIVRQIGGAAPGPSPDWQIDTKTGVAVNKNDPTQVMRLPGLGEQQAPFTIPEGASQDEIAKIYREYGTSISAANPVEAERYFALADRFLPPPKEEKPPTDAQAKAGGYWNRMSSASQILDPLEQSNQYPTWSASVPGGALARNLVMSPEQQQYYQAAMNWIRANLRKESGAVIGEQEAADEYANYFPMPGDSDAVIAQKRENRKRLEENLRIESGPAAKLFQTPSGGGDDLSAQARAERERRQREGK